MIEQFKVARRRGVPLMVVHTADQMGTATAITVNIVPEGSPVLIWDAFAGLRGRNEAGKAVFSKLGVEQEDTVGFGRMLEAIAKLPKGSVVVAMNAHRQLTSSEPMAIAATLQGVLNLRDAFKENFRSLVLLCPGFKLPIEMEQDVITLNDPLPTRTQLRTVVLDVYKAAKLPAKSETVDKAVEALAGLSLFAAEQVVAMSFVAASESEDKTPYLDLNRLWERKRIVIEQARGLSVYRGTESLDDVVGLDNIKARLRQRMHGRRSLGCVVMIDEIDKVFANVEHDTSGVRMDQLRTMLTEMENNRWGGVILAGLPGGGKSLLAKALGNEAGVPTIVMDLAGMEGGIVGESETNLRHAIDVIKAVGDGNAFIVATSNNATIMRPELQRRFTGGFFFFDLLTKEERSAAWSYYIQKFELDPKQPIPDDDGWTAAEIRNCAEEAWNCNTTLKDAARFIIPVATARSVEFDQMRLYASGRYLSATHPGTYKYDPTPMASHLAQVETKDPVAEASGKRAMDLMAELAEAAVASKLAGMKES